MGAGFWGLSGGFCMRGFWGSLLVGAWCAGTVWGSVSSAPAAAALPRQPAEGRPLAERFAEPPPSARILKIIHKQPDRPEEQDRALARLVAQGFGGFAGNVSFDGYVDDESKWPAFLRGVRLAKEAGLSLWLYDECGYPSGSARDLTLKGHPEWAARGLLVAEAHAADGAAVDLALPPGRLVLAAALPRRGGVVALAEARDLGGAVAAGRLVWQAPAGEWFVVAMTDDLIYEGTHAAISLAYKKPCIDLLTPEPTARFIEETHARYAARLGRDLGRTFVATFTDEPSLQNLWFRPMPYRVLPWSLTFEREFGRRRGRELRPLLPALVAEAGPDGAWARYAFWSTVGELVEENYFGQLQRWCRQHGLASGGHLLMEESLVSHVPLYGDFFRCVRRLDAPSIDCLTSLPPEVPWSVARLIGSAADLEGRAVTMCEVSDHSQRYRPQGDTRPVRTVTEDEIRGTCHRLIWGGINTLTSYYAFKDLTDEQLRRLNMQIGRCQTLLRGGHQVADVAVLYPVESLWPAFVPAHKGATDAPAARRVESVFDGVSQSLYAANRDFAYVDARALCEASVRGGALAHGALRWRVLVLPAVDTLPLEAWEQVARFWRAGGAVVAVGARPANSATELPSTRVQELARELFGEGGGPVSATNAAGGVGVLLPSGLLALTPRVVDALSARDVCGGREAGPVRVTRRRIDGRDVLFAINDSAAAWEGVLRFSGVGPDERWDPVTGTRTALAEAREVPLRLGPYGAMLFRARPSSPARRVAAGADFGGFSLRETPLPEASVTVGAGQHVRSELTPDGAGGWEARAVLSRGGVDTHQFVSFTYQRPPELAGAAGLAIDIAVPEGQRTPAELLVFIRTRDGGDYLAGTGRFLNAAGPARAHVLFSQFKPFHGARQTDTALDPTQVAAIRVGWGGYFGAEGERIGLGLRPPQRFDCDAPGLERARPASPATPPR